GVSVEYAHLLLAPSTILEVFQIAGGILAAAFPIFFAVFAYARGDKRTLWDRISGTRVVYERVTAMGRGVPKPRRHAWSLAEIPWSAAGRALAVALGMGFSQALRFALRVLARKPGFTAIVMLTLAVGIGAGSAMFSIINRLLWRPVDFPELDRLAVIQSRQNDSNYFNEVAPRTFLELSSDTSSFANVAAYQFWEVPLAGSGIDPEQVLAFQVSPGYFEMFGVRPELGRFFASDEVDGKNERVAILSHSLWDRRYGRDPAILGKSIIVAGESYPVVGIMPDDFRFP